MLQKLSGYIIATRTSLVVVQKLDLPPIYPCWGSPVARGCLASPGTNPLGGCSLPTGSPVEAHSRSCHRRNDRTTCWDKQKTSD